jgi:hypothetical protein
VPEADDDRQSDARLAIAGRFPEGSCLSIAVPRWSRLDGMIIRPAATIVTE